MLHRKTWLHQLGRIHDGLGRTKQNFDNEMSRDVRPDHAGFLSTLEKRPEIAADQLTDGVKYQASAFLTGASFA